MSLETIGSFIANLISPLACRISAKIAGRFGESNSPLRKVVVHSLAFVLILIPVSLLALAMVGLTIFSIQMLRAGI